MIACRNQFLRVNVGISCYYYGWCLGLYEGYDHKGYLHTDFSSIINNHPHEITEFHMTALNRGYQKHCVCQVVRRYNT